MLKRLHQVNVDVFHLVVGDLLTSLRQSFVDVICLAVESFGKLSSCIHYFP